MKTRQEYLDGKCTHSEYYSQFVNEQVRNIVEGRIGKERIKASTKDSFNDIPLNEWDSIAYSLKDAFLNDKIRKAGDYPTLAGKSMYSKRGGKTNKSK